MLQSDCVGDQGTDDQGGRDSATAFPLAHHREDADERRQANRAVAVSAIGLAATGLIGLLLAVVTGSVGSSPATSSGWAGGSTTRAAPAD